MAYCLLTGSTGFLGRYLLKDCLLAGLPVAVLIRSTNRERARGRLEGVLDYWDRRLGRALPRPIVFEGDVRQPRCGLSEQNLAWLRGNCDTLLHSAASMNFHASGPDGEPFQSNVGGTANVLEMCQAAGIRRFHQVSTAYICGLRQGLVLESELDLGQTNGNDYERSKMAAEKQIRAAEFLESATFYRPASIIGDSQDGYTTNFHGFYAPLQVLYTMAKALLGLGDTGRRLIAEAMSQAQFMDRLNLTGQEGKNLVPVDWVSAVITHVVRHPQWHGRTYHLTPRERVTVQTVREVFEQILRQYAGISAEVPATSIEAPPGEREAYERFFQEQMSTYNSHWRDDPVFDYTNTEQAAPRLPCPRVDREMLLRTSQFSVQGNFGWPRPAPVELEFVADDFLNGLLRQAPTAETMSSAAKGENRQRLGLEVTGAGGGQWTLLIDPAQPLAAQLGLPSDCAATYYMNSTTFAALTRRQLSVEQAVYVGSVVIEGDRPSDQRWTQTLQEVVTGGKA